MALNGNNMYYNSDMTRAEDPRDQHIELQLNLILEKKDISGSTSNRSQTFMSIIN